MKVRELIELTEFEYDGYEVLDEEGDWIRDYYAENLLIQELGETEVGMYDIRILITSGMKKVYLKIFIKEDC